MNWLKRWLGILRPLKNEEVEWIVNENAELGVKIGNQFFFLYKGRSYQGGEKWRPVFKREFGECCHPPGLDHTVGWGNVYKDYTQHPKGSSDDWKAQS